jgi:HD superfamily phosphohydrolase
MYSQVYLHAVRRIYDIHLKDFLSEWLPGGKFPIALEEYFSLTDNEVTVAIMQASTDSSLPGSSDLSPTNTAGALALKCRCLVKR